MFCPLVDLYRGDQMKRSLKDMVIRQRKALVVVPLATAAAALALATPAFASGGTSPTTNGCFSTWGNTGSNYHCTSPYATATGRYRNHLACNAQPDFVSSWVSIARGSKVDGLGQLNCAFKASSSRVEFTG
jgi:hypothetical protein